MNRLSRLGLAFCLTIIPAISAASQDRGAENTTSEARMITGRVISDSGQPLAGVSVFASRSGGASGQRTSTDNEGNFKLQALDSGFYRIGANLAGYVGFPQDPNSATYYRTGDSASLTLTKGGVIAGTITNIAGEPVVNVTIRAYKVRDADGNRVRTASVSQPRITDDRGYYRIYGLQPGTYVVAAGGQGQYLGAVNPFANDAPTYAPASTRDTAAEFSVRSDQEVTADIRYRGEPGHSVSGRVSGPAPNSPTGNIGLGGVGVRLTDIDSRAVISSAGATGDDRVFQINGISDGEYELSAAAGAGPNTDLSVSVPRRITVKGADVTGLELVLAPLGSINGRVVIENDEKLKCGRRRENAMRETLVAIKRDRVEEKTGTQSKDKTEEIDTTLFPTATESVPNEKGEINLRNLFPANYRFEIRPPGAGWYIREISSGSASPNRPAALNIPRNGFPVKWGDRSAVTITITEGGAGLRGKIAVAEGQTLPPGLKVYLVPVERENAENVLRFFEGTLTGAGTFAIGNIVPGRYWIIAQLAEALDANTFKSIKDDDTLRAKVLHDAEALKKEISFKPCERNLDYELSYDQKASPK